MFVCLKVYNLICLQLEKEADDPVELAEIALVQQLVSDHLKDVEMNRLPKVARRMGVSIDQVKRALELLKRLNPRPGRDLVPEPSQIVIPDVQIEYDPIHDEYVAALSRGRQSSLRINPQYQKLSSLIYPVYWLKCLA